MKEERYITQAEFARRVDQYSTRISYLIRKEKIQTVVVGGIKFVKNTKANFDAAKRRTV